MWSLTKGLDARLANRQFLPRDSMLQRYILSSCVCPYDCLSVCPSVCHKPALYQNGKTQTQTTPYDSTRTLVFCCQRSGRNIDGITPKGAPNRGCLLCLSASITQKPQVQFYVVLTLAVARSSSNSSAICYVLSVL